MSDIIHSPSVQPIFWGAFYSRTVIRILETFLVDLVAGAYMNGLAQYGIKRGRMLPSVRISDPEPTTLDNRRGDVEIKMRDWLERAVVPRPSLDEATLVYLILPPVVTELLYHASDEDPTGVGVQGWHGCSKWHERSSRPDVIFGIVKTNDTDRSTVMSFLNDSSVAQKIAHELIEAFNDPFLNGREELGDGFESKTYRYKGKWLVQEYKSVWDGGSIAGERPVSMRKFLSAIQADPAAGVRVLGLRRVTVDAVADAMAAR